MHFSKAEKVLHDTNNFNPPPGYYSFEQANTNKSINISNNNFSKQQRFNSKQASSVPGPGHYYNDKAERVRRRIVEEARKNQLQFKVGNNAESEIKISSIPSIPKKSTTRVYQELAPGILILHQQQNQSLSLGPGSYNVNHDVNHKKTVAYKINPQHKKRPEPEQPIIKIPTIAEEIRNEKRQLYKRNLIKTTGLSKNIVSPSDLCLQVIILRQKLLRSEENPPPGYYYNQKYHTSFKQVDPDLLPEYQLMMGKQERFKESKDKQAVGPGAYQIQVQNKKLQQGGYITKAQRQLHQKNKKFVPGPGAYKIQNPHLQPAQAKGNYPPIFGSGSSRFNQYNSAISQTPGPGSYKTQKPRNKQKYIKIKKNFYQSQFVKPQTQQANKDLISLSGDKSRTFQTSYFKQRNKSTNNHYFKSKVQRFIDQQKKNQMPVGPGNYQIANTALLKQSFNRNQNTYTGTKQPRFDDIKIRPNLGPGAYYVQSK